MGTFSGGDDTTEAYVRPGQAYRHQLIPSPLHSNIYMQALSRSIRVASQARDTREIGSIHVQ